MSGQIPTALGPQVGLIISGSDIGTIGGYTARATCPIGPAIQATASIAVADFPADVAVDDGLASPPAGAVVSVAAAVAAREGVPSEALPAPADAALRLTAAGDVVADDLVEQGVCAYLSCHDLPYHRVSPCVVGEVSQ